jgi:hypothetical protein
MIIELSPVVLCTNSLLSNALYVFPELHTHQAERRGYDVCNELIILRGCIWRKERSATVGREEAA